MRGGGWLLRGLVSLALLPGTRAWAQAGAAPSRRATAADEAAAIGDRERSAVTFTGYDLAVQLRPADAGISVLARVTVRNDGDRPMGVIPLQISSLLHWDGASERLGEQTEKLAFSQHALQTDADGTGSANEALLPLTKPLAAGASVGLTLFYSGAITGRRVAGASEFGTSDSGSSGSGAADAVAGWDVIAPEGTFLRGYGSVLWYPSSSPQTFLGEDAGFAHAVGLQRLRQARASVRLRVSVVYVGEAPTQVFFCGRGELLKATNDDETAPVADTTGVATAEFGTGESGTLELGFRTPSLFVLGRSVGGIRGAIALVPADADAAERMSAAAAPVLPLLTEWIGPTAPVLTIVDHPGVAFADGELLVAPVGGVKAGAVTPETASPLTEGGVHPLTELLVRPLTRSRFQSRYAWLEEGVPELVSLLWTERSQGRAAAVSELAEQAHALALAESADRGGQAEGSLLTESDAVFYRTKAASVLWMLRDLVGDDVLKQVLRRYPAEERAGGTGVDAAGSVDPKAVQSKAPEAKTSGKAEAFERLVERVSGKDLRWLFEDWVYHDRGLPDLSIVRVEPRQVAATGVQGTGWLVAVDVRNDGGAGAIVPVTVRSGTLTATERLRVNAHASAATRILFQVAPEQVQVNDGTVPELVTSTHVREVASPR